MKDRKVRNVLLKNAYGPKLIPFKNNSIDNSDK